MSYVIQLDQSDADDRARVGGKAASLIRLAAAGVPVPPGYVVGTDAYRAFIQDNGIDDFIVEVIDDIDHDKPGSLEPVTAAIRERILEAEIPASVKEAVTDAYAALGGDLHVAVRSSGTAEDMQGASFAGLYDTFLDIRGAEDVLTAVKKCWASLWTSRCTSYRNRLGIDHDEALVAVVVQVMIDADKAGVMFTANPMTSRTDQFVINSNWGLGESIASGIATPDEYLLDTDTLDVTTRTLGPKEKTITRAPDGRGTVTLDTPADQVVQPTLTDDEAAELGLQGRQVMELNGGLPQDLEWAMEDGSVFILQSRPVTGADFLWEEDVEAWQTAPDDPDVIWSNAWAQQFWTGAVSPLFYSVRGRELRNSDQRLFTLWGLDDLADVRRFKYRRATVYFSADADREYYRRMLPPMLRKYRVDNLPPSWREEAAAADFDPMKAVSIHARVRFLSSDQGPLRSIATVYEFLDNRIDEANGPDDAQLRRMSDEALLENIAHKIQMFEDFLTVLRPLFHVYFPIVVGVLNEMLNSWYQGDTKHAFQDLLTGLPERTAMAQEQADMWELVQQLRTSDALSGHLASASSAEEFFDNLSDVDGGSAFAKSYQEFLTEHGHRGHQDRDLWYPRRSEDPSIDFQSFRTMVGGTSSGSPEEHEERLREQRLETTDQVLADIRRTPFGSMKAELFKYVLNYVHRFLVVRDDERPFVDRITMAKKRGFAELGRRLFERGVLDSEDDFYFLAEHELYDALERKELTDLGSAKIANRREVFEAFLRREEVPAMYLRGNDPVDLEADDDTGEEGVYAGTGTSRGTVTATARIVPDLKEIDKLEQGDILVCNATDPGWTPAFSIISGLVLETGGMLAHGACLSREYGLPAVTLPRAMGKIPDGAQISIDGDTGRVRVHA